MKGNTLWILALLVTLLSCEKKESPLPPASGQFIEAGIGAAYDRQLYFNVLTGEFVKEDSRDSHDLLIEGSPDGRYIHLASANFQFVKNKGTVAFSSVTDTVGGPWLYDYPTGEGHRTAFGRWFNEDGSSKGEVFILDLGLDAQGNPLGYKKIQFLSVDDSEYRIRYANLDNTGDTTLSVSKDPDHFLIGFSFHTNTVVDAQPLSGDWHLLFTQYTDYDLTTEGDTQAYLVRGVLLNPTQTEAIMLQDQNWNALDRDAAIGKTFSDDWNEIGYRWKYYDFDQAAYVVRENYQYLIRLKSGNWYKMRFVGFYNDQGEKGYPRFEIIGL
ncbi:MAG: HmuY family protein [Bacteroidota bacterium]|nr:HmuY family protein [Bacteroidota bacterium]